VEEVNPCSIREMEVECEDEEAGLYDLSHQEREFQLMIPLRSTLQNC
jgi:hypothetical protein